MQPNRFKTSGTYLSSDDRKRRRREIIIAIFIVLVLAVLTFAENRLLHFSGEFPVSSTILMFIFININLLLLLLLIFLVVRNLVKLLYDRRRKVMGARLRTRLVVAFISLTLLPTAVLFFFAIHFITTSITFWFNVPVEQALENSLQVGRHIYTSAEDSNRFFAERLSNQIHNRNLLDAGRAEGLTRYLQSAQREYNLDAVEVYAPSTQRLAMTTLPLFEAPPLDVLSAANLQRDILPGGITSVSESYAEGEVIRTIGAIPFTAKRSEALALVVVSTFIPAALNENLAAISRGVEEYQQIKLLRKPIQSTYYIMLSIVALLVLFCAVWFGFYLAKSISIPIKELADGTRRVAEGDLNFSIGVVADDEIGSLVDSFNKMTRDLRISRDQLELSSRMLRQQNVEIEEKRQYMEVVLRNVSTGVITFGAAGVVTTVNKSAEKMLNLKAAALLGQSYQLLLNSPYLELAEEMLQKFKNSRIDSQQLPLHLNFKGRPRSFLLHINALKDDSGAHLGIVVVFDDLTELERAQRMAAWREVARRIAHEVKNPLTPITLSAQRLKRKFSDSIKDPVFEECTRMITEHVDVIRNLVNEFSNFARFPSANLRPCDLPPIIEETVDLYREGYPHIVFNIDMPTPVPQLELDRQQIKQALINLIDNAIAAIRQQGRIDITTAWDAVQKKVYLEVADDGVGISAENRTRLFEPDFSTKAMGMGLGLTIVSTIIEDHKGRISVQDNQPRGARFVIELPAGGDE